MASRSIGYDYVFSSCSKSLSFVSELTRREIFIKIMVIANVLLFFFVQNYLFNFSKAYPISIRHFNYAENPVSLESIEEARTRIFELINSTSNKLVFNQLKYASDAFYDLNTNIVGNAEFPVYNQFQRQPYVANGYIGSRIPNVGQGFSYDQITDSPIAAEDDVINGWPLFNKRYAGGFIAGFYNIQARVNQTNFPELYANGYESIIAAVPQWTTLTISAEKDGNNYTLDPSLPIDLLGSIINYVQNLSLSDGIVTTEFTWLNSIQIKLDVLAHRSQINLGVVNLEIANLGNSSLDIKVEDKLDFNSAQRSQLTEVNHDDEGIFITFQPHEIGYVNGAMYSKLVGADNLVKAITNDSVSQSTKIRIGSSESINLTKFVGIVSSDLDPKNFDSTEKVLMFAKGTATKQPDVHKVIQLHKLAWEKTLESAPAITFPSDLLLTLAARASLYHLAANTRSDAEDVTAALSVCGLSSDCYGGLVFWDADLWMLNGILPFIPSHARSIVNYRKYTHEQSKMNVPTGYEGAVYPWTSGRFGNCTSTGPCLDYEYHINVAVAMAAWELYLSGATDDEFLLDVAYPLIYDAAKFLSEYVVKYDETLGKYVTRNLTDPDEYANQIDNGAYTNAGISAVIKWAILVSNHLGKAIPSKFTDVVGNVYLPTSNNTDNITLEYSGMNSSIAIKQADVIMLTYPLGNELISEAQAYTNMEFYSMKQVSYGPAMTFPIFSIVASNLSPSGCASQSYLQKAVQPFLRGPFVQFSEQNNDNFLTNGGTHPAFPFLTAHGGFLQAVLQGLTGFRFDFEIENNNFSRILTLDPISLPCLEDGIILDGIKYLNHSLSLSINDTSFIVKNNGGINEFANDSIKISIGERNPAKGKYILRNNDEMVFPLFEPVKTFPSSISECGLAKFINITNGAFGDASSSINDGDNTTQWQVQTNYTTGKVLVDLREAKNLTRGVINWGDKPPKSWTLSSFSFKYNLSDVTDILSKVDFGNDLYKDYQFNNLEGQLYQQDDAFQVIIKENVEISAPFDPKEFAEAQIPKRHNTTTFTIDQGFLTRFLLIEVDGIHDTEPTDDSYGGAKLYEVVFY